MFCKTGTDYEKGVWLSKYNLIGAWALADDEWDGINVSLLLYPAKTGMDLKKQVQIPAFDNCL